MVEERKKKMEEEKTVRVFCGPQEVILQKEEENYMGAGAEGTGWAAGMSMVMTPGAAAL